MFAALQEAHHGLVWLQWLGMQQHAIDTWQRLHRRALGAICCFFTAAALGIMIDVVLIIATPTHPLQITDHPYVRVTYMLRISHPFLLS